mmetsp:Transcript_23355/g.20279  ORF Transcript_23355/g.20279 Transcript_23355/m.20279 type:complete len:296 (-) Transcript_23355:943-1830(-)
MKNLKYVFDEIEPELIEHCVVKIHDNLGRAFDEHYTVFEFLYGRIDTSLKPHDSLVWGASIITGDKELYEKTLMDSMERIKNKIARNQLIEGNEVAAMLTNIVKDITSVQEFANNLGYITKTFLKPNNISLPQIFNSIKDFHEDPSLSAKLFAFSKILAEYEPVDEEKKAEEEEGADHVDDLQAKRKKSDISAETSSGISKKRTPAYMSKNVDQIPPTDDLVAKRSFSDYPKRVSDYAGVKLTDKKIEENEMKTIFDYAKVILEYNKLGPIAFITPELGRWSTMGGLGVMVDELS